MNFLTPLYALGALAVALPILFHLIRKQPQGQQLFSSLMFLEPSPPRLTRKSRIDQWLLLLLRAAALILLAMAFTRPYWNTPLATDLEQPGMRRMILVDTSASMQRPDLMGNARNDIDRLLDEFSPSDLVSLYSFDSQLKPLVSVADASETPIANRKSNLRTALKSLEASWQSTDVGLALITAADLLQSELGEDTDAKAVTNEIILVTDFQNGADLSRLESYQWPANCFVRVRRISPQSPGNTSLSILESMSGEADVDSSAKDDKLATELDSRLRVRVVNQADSTSESFSLQWFDEKGEAMAIPATTCRVAKGSSMIVRVPLPPAGNAVLRLTGDQALFDNDWYHSVSAPPVFQVVYVGNREKPATENSGYFVEQLPLGTEEYRVEFQWRQVNSNDPWPDPNQAPLIILGEDASERDMTHLNEHVTQGGSVLWTLDRSSTDAVDGARWQQQFAWLTGQTPTAITEATVKNYAMLEAIQFQHPLFASLSDSRFNDFTKIRFWHHRTVELADEANWQTLARFDDGSPALLNTSLGKGQIWILAAGWQPAESQFAVSSKFVPTLSRIFQLAAPYRPQNEQYSVGDTLSLRDDERIIDTEGKDVQAVSSMVRLTIPGFHLRQSGEGDGGQQTTLAVNLSSDESDTTVGDIDRLERLGVKLSMPTKSTEEKATIQRQLKASELEAKQSLWRWLLVGVLAAVALESLLFLRRVPRPAT